MRKKDTQIDTQVVETEIVEQPIVEVEKKKPFAFLRKKEKDIAINLDKKMVKEFDGPFGLVQHKVTGKEFNSFILETQDAIIQMKQDMTAFTGRVDGIGDDLAKVDKRHNKVNETTVQVLKQAIDEMQSKVQMVEEYKKSIRMYQVISCIAVIAAVAELILFLIK